MNNCDVTPPRRKTRFPRRRRNRFLHGEDEDNDSDGEHDERDDDDAMKASLIRENYSQSVLTSSAILIPRCSVDSFRPAVTHVGDKVTVGSREPVSRTGRAVIA